MAVLWECGFEAGNKTYYTEHGWSMGASTVITSTAGEVHESLSNNGGNYAMKAVNNIRSPVIGSFGDVWLNFWLGKLYYDSFNLDFRKSTVVAARVRFDGGGTIYVYRGASSTLLATGRWNPSANHWISIRASLLSVGGTIDVKIDGASVASYSGDTTATTDGWDQFDFSSSFTGRNLDDFLISDAEMGEYYIPAIFPDADNAPLELTPSTGTNHWEIVDQVPVASKTAYNSASAVNQEDNYDNTSISWTPDTGGISCVGVWGYATRDGTITQAKLICNATKGTAQTLPAVGTWLPIEEVWNTDPADSNPWTKAKIDAIVSGIEFA